MGEHARATSLLSILICTSDHSDEWLSVIYDCHKIYPRQKVTAKEYRMENEDVFSRLKVNSEIFNLEIEYFESIGDPERIYYFV